RRLSNSHKRHNKTQKEEREGGWSDENSATPTPSIFPFCVLLCLLWLCFPAQAACRGSTSGPGSGHCRCKPASAPNTPTTICVVWLASTGIRSTPAWYGTAGNVTDCT